MLRIAALLAHRHSARVALCGVAIALSLVVAQSRAADAEGGSRAPCDGACGEIAIRERIVARSADPAASDAPRVDLRGATPPVVTFRDFVTVPVGVPFVVGATFASVFGYARSKLARRCDGCAVAEQGAQDFVPATGDGWRYVVGGIHVAALIGAVVLVAAVEGTPHRGRPGTARLDSLRLVIAPTNGGAAVSLSGAF